jgi:uncharacterized protein YbjQ (UPF0145 family)
MILTTTNTIEGRPIQDYLGIVTGVSNNVKTAFSFKSAKNKRYKTGCECCSWYKIRY